MQTANSTSNKSCNNMSETCIRSNTITTAAYSTNDTTTVQTETDDSNQPFPFDMNESHNNYSNSNIFIDETEESIYSFDDAASYDFVMKSRINYTPDIISSNSITTNTQTNTTNSNIFQNSTLQYKPRSNPAFSCKAVSSITSGDLPDINPITYTTTLHTHTLAAAAVPGGGDGVRLGLGQNQTCPPIRDEPDQYITQANSRYDIMKLPYINNSDINTNITINDFIITSHITNSTHSTIYRGILNTNSGNISGQFPPKFNGKLSRKSSILSVSSSSSSSSSHTNNNSNNSNNNSNTPTNNSNNINHNIVIKALNECSLNDDVAQRDYDTEIDILCRISHPNIVQLKGYGYLTASYTNSNSSNNSNNNGKGYICMYHYLRILHLYDICVYSIV